MLINLLLWNYALAHWQNATHNQQWHISQFVFIIWWNCLSTRVCQKYRYIVIRDDFNANKVCIMTTWACDQWCQLAAVATSNGRLIILRVANTGRISNDNFRGIVASVKRGREGHAWLYSPSQLFTFPSKSTYTRSLSPLSTDAFESGQIAFSKKCISMCATCNQITADRSLIVLSIVFTIINTLLVNK